MIKDIIYEMFYKLSKKKYIGKFVYKLVFGEKNFEIYKKIFEKEVVYNTLIKPNLKYNVVKSTLYPIQMPLSYIDMAKDKQRLKRSY
jgi:hypothetical protein